MNITKAQLEKAYILWRVEAREKPDDFMEDGTEATLSDEEFGKEYANALWLFVKRAQND